MYVLIDVVENITFNLYNIPLSYTIPILQQPHDNVRQCTRGWVANYRDRAGRYE